MGRCREGGGCCGGCDGRATARVRGRRERHAEPRTELVSPRHGVIRFLRFQCHHVSRAQTAVESCEDAQSSARVRAASNLYSQSLVVLVLLARGAHSGGAVLVAQRLLQQRRRKARVPVVAVAVVAEAEHDGVDRLRPRRPRAQCLATPAGRGLTRCGAGAAAARTISYTEKNMLAMPCAMRSATRMGRIGDDR